MLNLALTLVVLCFFSVGRGQNASAPAGGSKWVHLPGNVKHISAKGDKLWAVTKNHQILQYVGNGWVTHSGEGSDVAATDDGNAWIKNDFNGDKNPNFVRFNGTQNAALPQVTINVGSGQFSLNMRLLVDISAYSLSAAVGIDLFGSVVRYDPTTGVFFKVNSAASNTRDVSIGNQSELWRIDQNDVLYRFDGKVWKEQNINAGVTPVPIPVSVSVGGPNRVAVVDTLNEIYFYNGQRMEKYYNSTR